MMLSKDELEATAFTQSQFTSSIERAQKQMEAWHFGIRKHLYEYDTVINKQRTAIYAKRDWMLQLDAQKKEAQPAVDTIALTTDTTGTQPTTQTNDSDTKSDTNIVQLTIRDEIKHFIEDVVAEHVSLYTAYTPWNISELCESLQQVTGNVFIEDEYASIKTTNQLKETLTTQIHEMLDIKLNATPNQDRVEDVCRRIYLAVIDKYWMEHIDEMQYLREKVSLYGYAQLDPLVIYKQEAFNKYQALLMTIKKETLGRILRTDLIGTEQQLAQEATHLIGDQNGQEVVLDLLKEVAEHISQNPQAFPQQSAQQQRGGRVVAEGVTASGQKKTIETTYGQAKVLSE